MDCIMPDIENYAAVGVEAAIEAGNHVLRRLSTQFRVSHKGIVNLVTEADLEAEELIVSRIRKAFPAHSILAEEKHKDTREGEFCWIIDPLDGTTNYAHGFPVFSVSIGLEISGKVEWGVIYNPVVSELYTARRGGGAFCNDASIHVSAVESLGASLLATGFPYDIQTSPVNNLDNFCAFARRTQGIRRCGSAALDFCAVAAGRLDGFWELKLNPWDCSAGYLMVEEAGGTVSDFHGEPASIYGGEFIASNGLIHQQMVNVLKSVIPNRNS
jgi:myo-inositol-1(or 4)-monophosphatase